MLSSMPESANLAEQILQRFSKSRLKKKVGRLIYVSSVLKQKVSLLSDAQNRPVDVSDASKCPVHLNAASSEEVPTPVNCLFMTRCTSTPCRLVAPEVWCDHSEHDVGYVGGGKWLFHRRVTSQITTVSVSGDHYQLSPGLRGDQQSVSAGCSLHTAFVSYRSGLSRLVSGECSKPLGCALPPQPFAGIMKGKSLVIVRFQPYGDNGITMILCAAHLPPAANLFELDAFNEALLAMYLRQPSCIQTFLTGLGCRKMRASGCCPPGGVCVYGKSENVGVTKEFTL